MVDPHVFEAVDYDASKVTGFAFGMGIERVVAWISGIHHAREAIPYPRTIKSLYP